MRKFKFIICTVCEGFGKMENPAFSNGFTSSEWADMDEDSQRNYMAGDYDVTCTCCKGSGKEKVPNLEAMTFAEKRVLAAERREAREDAQYNRECALERMMGC